MPVVSNMNASTKYGAQMTQPWQPLARNREISRRTRQVRYATTFARLVLLGNALQGPELEGRHRPNVFLL